MRAEHDRWRLHLSTEASGAVVAACAAARSGREIAAEPRATPARPLVTQGDPLPGGAPWPARDHGSLALQCATRCWLLVCQKTPSRKLSGLKAILASPSSVCDAGDITIWAKFFFMLQLRGRWTLAVGADPGGRNQELSRDRPSKRRPSVSTWPPALKVALSRLVC